MSEGKRTEPEKRKLGQNDDGESGSQKKAREVNREGRTVTEEKRNEDRRNADDEFERRRSGDDEFERVRDFAIWGKIMAKPQFRI